MSTSPELLTTWRSRPVFVTSTFRDMHAERDYLRDHVFPVLEERLQERHHYLEPIDLRQGVETASLAEERARELQVLKVCLDEIERSRPFLLVLLGDRYGWVPPEERIAAAAQEAGLATEAAGKSVTALEIEFGLLKKDPAQRRRSLFYFREPPPYAEMPPAVAAEYSDAYADDPAVRAGHERLNALKKRIEDDPELSGRVRTYRLGWDAEAQALTGLQDWGRQVLEDLWAELDAETRASLAEAPTTLAGQERAQLEEFVEHKLRDFRGRAEVIRNLADLARSPIAADASWFACVTGPSGSGKSTVFARLYRELTQDGELVVLAHAAGSSPRSSQVEPMLRRWIEELAQHLGETSPLSETSDRDEIEQAFARLLHRVSGQRRVVVLLDALNQFDPTPQARHLTWIPKLWPDNARLIATALPGPEAEALRQRPRVTAIELQPLDETEARDIARAVWRRYHRECNPDVLNRVLELHRDDGLPAHSNPLWLTLAMEQLNLLDADDFTAAGQNLHELLLQKAAALPADLTGLYRELLARAEKLFGAAWTRSFVALIALSRNGWRESDLQALLAPSARLLVPEEPPPEWDPLRFAALRRTFRAQVMQRGSHGRWDFSHAQMRAAVEHQLLADAEQIRRLHAAISDYLENLPATDPLIPLERMRHLIGEGNALRAARYYATLDGSTGTNASERVGSTSTLVDWIVAGQAENVENTRLAWITCWLQEPKLMPEEVYRVSSNFRFDLLERMANDTSLPTRQRLIEAFRAALEDLATVDPVNAGWQSARAVSHCSIGDVLRAQGDLDGALEAYQASLAIDERLATADPSNALWLHRLSVSRDRIGLVMHDRGDLVGALTAYRASLSIREREVAADPSNVEWQRALAVSHTNIGRLLQDRGDLAGALTAYRASLSIREWGVAADPSYVMGQHDLAASHMNIGGVLQDRGDLAGALTAYRASMAIAERLAAADPSNAVPQRTLLCAHHRVGGVLQERGDLAGALIAYRESLAIAERLAAADPSNVERQCDLAVTHNYIGDGLQDEGGLPGALTAHRASLTICERLAAADPSNAARQFDLSRSHERVGVVLQAQGDLAGAIQAFRASLAIGERLIATDPSNTAWQHLLALSHIHIGDVLKGLGDLAGALEAYRASHAICERLAGVDPSNSVWQRSLSVSLNRVSDVLKDQRDLIGALEAYRTALAIAERLAAADPFNTVWQRDLSVTRYNMATVLLDRGFEALHDQGDLAGALEAYRAAVAILERLATADPTNARGQIKLFQSHTSIGTLLQTQGDLAGALEAYQKSVAIAERPPLADPSNTGWQKFLSDGYDSVGGVLRDQGNLAGALEAYRASLAIRERLTAADPSNAEWQRGLSAIHSKIGGVLQEQGDLAGALAAYRANLAIAEQLAAADPSNDEWQDDLAECYSCVGTLLPAESDLAGALAAHRASLTIRERLAAADPASARWESMLVSHTCIGIILQAQADLAGALEAYRRSVAISERLAADSSNAGWQNILAERQDRVGGVLRDQGELAGALQAYRASLTTRERLAAADPSNASWQHDLAASHSYVAETLQAQGDLAGALAAYRASLTIAERLAAADPSNTDSQRGLWVSCYKIGGALQEAGDPSGRNFWRRACDILSAMLKRGLHVSPNDQQVLAWLRAQLG